MKKLLGAVALAAISAIVAGCGGKPKIPADTVAAAYVDLDKAFVNAVDVIEEAIGEIPDKDKRKKAAEEFKEFQKEHAKDVSAADFEWLAATASKDGQFGVVVKCDLDGKLPSKDKRKLKEVLSDFLSEAGEEGGCKVYRAPFMPFLLAFVDDDYIVAASTQKYLGRLVALYKDGDGEKSEDFDGLTDIGGDTIARIQVAKVETFIALFDLKDKFGELAEKTGDADLVDMVKDIENVTFDVNFSDDEIGSVLTVDAGSRYLAKVVESAFNVLAFANRVMIDATLAGAGSSFERTIARQVPGLRASELDEIIKAAGHLMRDAVEVDRSGSTATYTVEIDTGDFLEAVVPAMVK